MGRPLSQAAAERVQRVRVCEQQMTAKTRVRVIDVRAPLPRLQFVAGDIELGVVDEIQQNVCSTAQAQPQILKCLQLMSQKKRTKKCPQPTNNQPPPPHTQTHNKKRQTASRVVH
jgi:hypothetical protein